MPKASALTMGVPWHSSLALQLIFVVYHFSNPASNLSVDSKKISCPLKPVSKALVLEEEVQALILTSEWRRWREQAIVRSLSFLLGAVPCLMSIHPYKRCLTYSSIMLFGVSGVYKCII